MQQQEYRYSRRAGFHVSGHSVSFRKRWVRSVAQRHWGSHCQVPQDLADAAAAAQQTVMEGYGWSELLSNHVRSIREFGNGTLSAQRFVPRAQALLSSFGTSRRNVRGQMWLACHEVEFHIDDGIAEERAFIIWHVAGPPKVVDFPNMACGIGMSLGDALLFDGMQPHGVRLPTNAGHRFLVEGVAQNVPTDPAGVTVFLSIDVALTLQMMKRLQVQLRRKDPNAPTPRIAVDNCTGKSRIETMQVLPRSSWADF